MTKSFYQYVLKFRDGKKGDRFGLFAEEIYQDLSFPKHSSDYDEISSYIEMNNTSLEAVKLFDELWVMYEQDVIGL
ncbi:YozE family protein [Calidifontibacillus erzurumensis]|uniref:UPF0346 protein HR057_03885 n=1 Tax=Calidifontibacillus erzurumensis TaxID=2741433 RepID=A0A8J8KDP5_9BACI|nr:YozE family protein [Calidifontibacillus erzurumensis]NSL50905.1 YozE family protein [Calidifontibacillus erzurumensis]